ncbi:unnamed protein product, partial [marine sediment metagenome]
DILLSHGACELCSVMLTAKDGMAVIDIYAGSSTGGKFLARIETFANRSQMFSPKEPVYCRGGLYIDVRE